MRLSTQTLTLILLTLNSALTLAIPQSDSTEICVSKSDCYPKEFLPTIEWQIIREGQVIPQGLDIQLDWQTGEKRAKLPDSVGSFEELQRLLHKVEEQDDNIREISKELVMKEPIEEDDSKKIVSYNNDDDDVTDDEEERSILALKQAAMGSGSVIDLNEALTFIKVGAHKDDEKLLIALESLNEYSHNLKDGVRISNEANFNGLFDIAIKSGNYHAKELSLRIIAQSLRHNLKALENIDPKYVLTETLKALDTETNSVIQKRLLGVVSSVLQTSHNVDVFLSLKGDKRLLKDFRNLQEDSKIRTLEILEDVDKLKLTKRDEVSTANDYQKELYNILEESLSTKSFKDEHNLDVIFTKLVELKQSNPSSFKPSKEFMMWLTNEIQARSLQKRDADEDFNEDLHKRLTEARHLVFGNPNALRKAFDEF